MTRIKVLFFLFVSIFILFSCKNENNYKKDPTGFRYKIITKNPEGKAVNKGNILTLKLKYFTQSDSLLFNSENLSSKFRVQVSNAGEDGMMQDALKIIKTGDSASFIIPAENFYKKTKRDSIPSFIFPDENLRFEVKIVDIVSEHQLNKEYKQYMLKKKAEEKQILKEYIRAENITKKPTVSGIYIIKLKTGKGNKAEIGKRVTINFKGTFINGKVFDSSIDKGRPVTFILGDEHVIPAWNEAIQSMKVGDKIKLIAPSETAYGQEGLQNYVPPFSTLIYEIKLLNVK